MNNQLSDTGSGETLVIITR